MKKRFAFMTALLMMSTLTNFSVYANETTTTGAYIPSDIPVETVENTTVVADNIEELEEICQKLHTILDEPTVYVAKRDGCVVFGSEKQADIDSAKAYCKENDIDLDLVCFILICEETSSYEETTPPYIPEDVKTEETTTVTTFEQPDKIAELEGICQKLHTILDAPTVYVAKRDGCVVFGSENQADIDSAKAYCEENGIDLNLVCFILIREETPSYEETTPPYIPEGVETEETTTVTTFEQPDRIAELEGICQKLHTILDAPTVYVAKRDGCVVFGSENQADIDSAKAYCEENGIDLNLVCFILIREEMPNDTVTTGPYIPDDVETEPTTETTATTTRKKVDPAKVKQLNAIYEQLKQFECLNNIIFYNAGYSDTIVFVSYNNNTEVINKVNQYIADNGIDKSLVVIETAVPEELESAAETTAVKGDISRDGMVNVADVVILQKYLAKKIDSIPETADMNGDSKINAFDLIMLKRMIMNN